MDHAPPKGPSLPVFFIDDGENLDRIEVAVRPITTWNTNSLNPEEDEDNED